MLSRVYHCITVHTCQATEKVTVSNIQIHWCQKQLPREEHKEITSWLPHHPVSVQIWFSVFSNLHKSQLKKKTNSYWSRLTAPFIEQLLFLSQDAALKCTRTMIYAKQYDSPFSSFLLGCQRASVSIELTISSIQNAKSSEESSLHMETKTE